MQSQPLGEDMRAYVINLDRRTDRMAHMSTVLAAHGISFERIAAVDGLLLNDTFIDEIRLYPRGVSHKLNRSHIGCYLSHIKAWKAFLESDSERAVIFEDDLHFGENFSAVLRTLDERFPASADVIKLETWAGAKVRLGRKPLAALEGRQLLYLASGHFGAAAYVTSRKGARKMLANSAKLAFGVDAMIFDQRNQLQQTITACQLDPAICIQDTVQGWSAARTTTLASDIGNNPEQAPKTYGTGISEIAANRFKDRMRVVQLAFKNLLTGTEKRQVPFV